MTSKEAMAKYRAEWLPLRAKLESAKKNGEAKEAKNGQRQSALLELYGLLLRSLLKLLERGWESLTRIAETPAAREGREGVQWIF